MTEHMEREIEVVINTCYGGYSLSEEAQLEIARRKGIVLRREGQHLFIGSGWTTVDDYPRDDPDVIDVVKKLGAKANGDCAKLKVARVTVNVSISSYDGMEEVAVSGGCYD